MAGNSVAEMVVDASNVDGATSGTGVVGGSVEVALSIGGVGAGGIDFV